MREASGGFLSGFALPIFKNKPKGGCLEVMERDGPLFTLGDGDGPHFAMRIQNPLTLWKIFRDPDLAFGEAYVEGKWDMARGDLGQMLTWLCRNYPDVVGALPSPHQNKNDPEASRKNVAHHYDLGNDLYKTFLDEGMNYSCAFFDDHRMSLRDAHLNKIYTTIERADIKPGMRILDIGCGWGEMARTLAHAAPGVNARGITLSENQIQYAREKNKSLSGSAPEFELVDYRLHAAQNPGAYDRIVSIGMFEHVGRQHYADYFSAINTLLKPGGKAIIHAIMRPEAITGAGTSRWLDAYIFPGGGIPYLPEALEAAMAQGLSADEPFIHEGTNYAETLRRWRRNFNDNFGQLNSTRYDARFRRIWNYYLASCEAAFDGMGFYVAQMPFKKPVY